MATVLTGQTTLSNEKIIELLSSDENLCINLPPINPTGGDVYLFSAGNSSNKKGTIYTDL